MDRSFSTARVPRAQPYLARQRSARSSKNPSAGRSDRSDLSNDLGTARHVALELLTAHTPGPHTSLDQSSLACLVWLVGRLCRRVYLKLLSRILNLGFNLVLLPGSKPARDCEETEKQGEGKLAEGEGCVTRKRRREARTTNENHRTQLLMHNPNSVASRRRRPTQDSSRTQRRSSAGDRLRLDPPFPR